MKRSLDAADEDDLVRRTAAGDRRAFDELYRRTSPWLLTRLRRRCADDDVVADVMQETYLAVWRAAGGFAGSATSGSAVGWLWTIAAHRLVDAFRRRARQSQVPPVPLAETVAPAAEDEVMAGWVGHDLEQALLVLPPEARQVLRATQRLYLAILWPVALAAGAWQARREHRSNVAELFGSTPRPRAHRAVPVLAAMAVAVVSGYLLMGLSGVLWNFDTADYLPVSVFTITAVGALALIAAAWLGLAIGRLLPTRVTAPILAVAGLALLLLIPGATRPRGWLALVFSPIYEMNMPGAWAAVPGRVSASQAVWLGALAVTAVLLFACGGWRVRVAALLPLAAGAALAIAVMPHHNRIVTDAVDPVAQELVCADGAPRVCVSRAHAGLLAEVTTAGREGLAVLAKLPDAPVEVHEDTTTYVPEGYPAWHPGIVLLHVEVGPDGHLPDGTGEAIDVVFGAFDTPPRCENRTGPAEKLAAAGWLTGREPVSHGLYDNPAMVAQAVALWQELRELPAGKATARVAELRSAALNCRVAAR